MTTSHIAQEDLEQLVELLSQPWLWRDDISLVDKQKEEKQSTIYELATGEARNRLRAPRYTLTFVDSEKEALSYAKKVAAERELQFLSLAIEVQRNGTFINDSKQVALPPKDFRLLLERHNIDLKEYLQWANTNGLYTQWIGYSKKVQVGNYFGQVYVFNLVKL